MHDQLLAIAQQGTADFDRIRSITGESPKLLATLASAQKLENYVSYIAKHSDRELLKSDMSHHMTPNTLETSSSIILTSS